MSDSETSDCSDCDSERAHRDSSSQCTTESDTTANSNYESGSKKMSNYLRFCQSMRPILKEENPDITFCEMGRKLGELWREKSDEEKQEYS